MPPKDPFSGIRLSEQTAPTKLDQRLFLSDPPPDPVPLPQPKSIAPLTTKPAGATANAPPSPTSAPPGPQHGPVSIAAIRFDLDDEPLYKASYVFTSEELEALEDLKLELRRELDTKVTKNDLIRSALHMLLEDHTASGARSYARRKIRKR